MGFHPVEVILGIVMMVLALFIVVLVLMQQGKDKKLSGTIAGGADTYYSKGKKHSKDVILSRLTIATAIVFCLLVVAMYVVLPILPRA
ncbi:MAG: preprotein translocase subunit SecG [Clostridia bacterium]|nr:preprotein translocase subunit SecG [Clostridia bacterium]